MAWIGPPDPGGLVQRLPRPPINNAALRAALIARLGLNPAARSRGERLKRGGPMRPRPGPQLTRGVVGPEPIFTHLPPNRPPLEPEEGIVAPGPAGYFLPQPWDPTMMVTDPATWDRFNPRYPGSKPPLMPEDPGGLPMLTDRTADADDLTGLLAQLAAAARARRGY